MGALDRLRRRRSNLGSAARQPRRPAMAVDADEEARLWGVLREDPNDSASFARLAETVRRRAEEHQTGDPVHAADDAVWALAEELAHSGRAWYPLVELARLSVHDDREAALRRLATAAERDPSGKALATGLLMLRDAQLPGDALNLGVGHWRPAEHDPDVGRQVIEAAIEAGRLADARRQLDALSQYPDPDRVTPVREELERLLSRAEQQRPPTVDVRDPRDRGGHGVLRVLRRR